jgi:hypothetical protein
MRTAICFSRGGMAIAGLSLVLASGLLAAEQADAPAVRPTVPPTNPTSVARTSTSNAAPAAIKLLKIEPVKGHVGDSFSINADGLPAG